MPWATLIPIIATYGLPLAQKLWEKAVSGKDVTAQDWTELQAIESQTAEWHLLQIANRLNLSLEDPKVKALSELIKA